MNELLFPLLLIPAAISSQDTALAPTVPPRAKSSWEKVACPFDTTKALLRVTCGRLKVPENYDRPGQVAEIAFMVVKPQRNIDARSPVIFLNGGPGGTSLHFAESLVANPHINDVVVDRDWVFFDQRGTGRSVPTLHCPPGEDWFTTVKTCRDQLKEHGVDLSQYNSARIARDMEALREALGVKQWNLWGISYGARLAITMARYYPSSVRSLVLDGASLPEGQELIDDARGTEVVLNKLFSKCAADAACSSRFPQLRTRFIAALPRLRQQPLSAGERRFDDGNVLRFIRNWLYPRGYSTFEQRIQSLLVFMDAAARGDGQLMLETQQRMRKEEGVDSRSEPPVPVYGQQSVGQNLSVYCNEEWPFQSMSEYQQAVASSAILRALLGGFANPSACSLWPAGQADPIANTPVYYDGPQLVFTGELDASLSGVDGYKIEMLNAHARNVVFRNGMHGQFRNELPTSEDSAYRMCALRLAREFFADPHRTLDTACAETRQLRLVR